jgi:hypothetical protein
MPRKLKISGRSHSFYDNIPANLGEGKTAQSDSMLTQITNMFGTDINTIQQIFVGNFDLSDDPYHIPTENAFRNHNLTIPSSSMIGTIFKISKAMNKGTKATNSAVASAILPFLTADRNRKSLRQAGLTYDEAWLLSLFTAYSPKTENKHNKYFEQRYLTGATDVFDDKGISTLKKFGIEIKKSRRRKNAKAGDKSAYKIFFKDASDGKNQLFFEGGTDDLTKSLLSRMRSKCIAHDVKTAFEKLPDIVRERISFALL